MKESNGMSGPFDGIDGENSSGLLDVTELVRSLQRRERNPDCFRRSQGDCDRTDCCWRQWCIHVFQEAEENGA